MWMGGWRIKFFDLQAMRISATTTSCVLIPLGHSPISTTSSPTLAM